MRLPESTLRRLLEVTWDVAIESTYLARMEIIAQAFEESVAADAFTNAVFRPTTVNSTPGSGAALTPVKTAFDLSPERHAYLKNYDLRHAELYAREYIQHDVFTPALMAEPGSVMKLSQIIPRARWGEDPWTGEFLPRIGFRHTLGTVLPVGDDLAVTFGAWRTPRRRDFTRDDIRVLKLFQPIVARATRAALLSEELATSGGTTAPEPATNGIALFSTAGALLHANAGARVLLARLARVPHASERIEAEIRCLAAAETRGNFVERTFLTDESAALRASFTRVGIDGAVVAVVFHELCLGPDARFGAAAARVGLTARECEISRLVLDGEGNKAIASALGVSLETVKTHLKRIFRKARVSGRTELAAALRGDT